MTDIESAQLSVPGIFEQNMLINVSMNVFLLHFYSSKVFT